MAKAEPKTFRVHLRQNYRGMRSAAEAAGQVASTDVIGEYMYVNHRGDLSISHGPAGRRDIIPATS